jgi:hypothetical protein
LRQLSYCGNIALWDGLIVLSHDGDTAVSSLFSELNLFIQRGGSTSRPTPKLH